jgi:hypothetical protein
MQKWLGFSSPDQIVFGGTRASKVLRVPWD